MATQPTLRFGSLSLCDPSNGLDGYEMTKHDLTKPDYIEIAIPNTAGRIKYIKGKGQSESTSLKVEFSCDANFSTASELMEFLDAVQERISDTRKNLDTVYFGIKNDGSIFNERNCDMEFEFKEVWVSENGYWLSFTVRFNKYGE